MIETTSHLVVSVQGVTLLVFYTAKQGIENWNSPMNSPFPPPNFPTMYRCIGLVQGQYFPSIDDFSQGIFIATDGSKYSSVLLSGVAKRLQASPTQLGKSHIWSVWLRTLKESPGLFLQLIYIYRPTDKTSPKVIAASVDYFSVRGVVFSQGEGKLSICIKRNQKPPVGEEKAQRWQPFTVVVDGFLQKQVQGQFWELDCKREGERLVMEDARPIQELLSKPKTNGVVAIESATNTAPLENSIDWEGLIGGEGNITTRNDVLRQFTKADFINQLLTLPSQLEKVPGIQVVGIPRTDLLHNWQFFYQSLCWWLNYLVLEEHEFLPMLRGFKKHELLAILLSSERAFTRPDADLSLATLDYCRQLWLKSTEIQELCPSGWNLLWFMVECGGCRYRLRNSAVSGVPNLIEGKLLTKNYTLNATSKSIKTYRQILRKRSCVAVGSLAFSSLAFLKDDTGEQMLDYVLIMGIIIAIKTDDSDLAFDCEKFLDALKHRKKIASDLLYQVARALPSGELDITDNGKRAKGFGNQNPRGRPPKS